MVFMSVFLFVACSSQNSAEQDSSADSSAQYDYQNTELGIAFNIPDEWAVEQDGVNLAVFSEDTLNEDKRHSSPIEIFLSSENDIPEIIEAYDAQVQNITVGTIASQKVRYEEMQTVFTVVVVPYEEGYLQFWKRFGEETELSQKQVDLAFDEILESFVFLNRQK
jgi:hypothetical protein